ncbi:MAG: restriction endonuclease subunit S [Aromatoleum sp.]|jgi:type I restriction enzyme S subunit|uniref:restriction endonuclease subunit S n=1 Tax=Aromatoleum sp. TaxID=2307007 RepID=UPI002893B3A4|nr:restriction endonuclease subunit S [Aromatoleum sp.]MDT3670762.1 restriction endonuclease subunit S [Aromatoleum sp.]
MSGVPLLALGELMATRRGSVDPSKFPDEQFDLYSIPAFDKGCHEVVIGSSIGSAKQIVQPNDVLLSKIVPHIRRSWVVGQNNGRRLIASGEWIVFRSEKADPGYLRHVLVSDPFHSQFMQTVSGVGGSLLRARPAQVAKIQIPVPSLPEQRRIAAILDQADALRAKRREALALLDELQRGIFIAMFGDPVTNPKGWERVPLGEVGRLERGVSKHRPRNAPQLLGGDYPLVQTGDVANSGGYIRNFSATYSEAGLKQSRLWPAGTLCITIAANIAKTGILKFDACFPDSVVGFTADELATVEFIRIWLSFLQKALEDSAPESAQKNINLAILRSLEVPLPPLDARIKFYEAIAELERIREQHRAAVEGIDSLLASLQHRAFRGEL